MAGLLSVMLVNILLKNSIYLKRGLTTSGTYLRGQGLTVRKARVCEVTITLARLYN